MQDMKETEDELKLKHQITPELLARQQRILNRMLDYDKSVREREYDNTRKSKTGVEKQVVSPAELSDDQVRARIRKENFNKDKFQYTPTYQNLIEEYYRLLDGKK